MTKQKLCSSVLFKCFVLITTQLCYSESDIETVPLTVGQPILYQKIPIPAELLSQHTNNNFGGDIRIGDLTGNGEVDFLVYRSTGNMHDGGGMKPSFLGAFTIDGEILWYTGRGGDQPGRPGPVALYDIDQDGSTEVIHFFVDQSVQSPPTSFKNVIVQIRNGSNGDLKKQASPSELTQLSGSGANWAHQRILITNLKGNPSPQEFMIKLGDTVLAFDHNLKILWTYTCPWTEYSQCPAYIPSVGDIDNDGKDEINGGYFLLDDDGSILWENKLGDHMDSVAIAKWDDGSMRAFCSGFGHVMDQSGNIILKLGKEIVPHGQELRVAHFDDTIPGPQMMIRHQGHTQDVILVCVEGKVIRQFKINESPNNTGMEAIYWNGMDQPALLYNGGILWNGNGTISHEFPNLDKPYGNKRQGWYHCIPANVCGDKREEVILYNPWDQYIYIYSPYPIKKELFEGYISQPRQYNARLMD